MVIKIAVVITLLFIASLAAVAAKRLRIPYTIGLVVVGLAAGWMASLVPALAPLAAVKMNPDIVFYILLPTLIFAAAIGIDARMLIDNIAAVLRLSTTGLVISALIVGGGLAAVSPLAFPVALLFGALISATDPVAVIALFGEIRAPRQLTVIVDGESIFNDATAVVLYNIVLPMALGGAAIGWQTIGYGALSFITVFFGGIAVGIAIGLVMSPVMRIERNDPLVPIALTTVVAYMTYLIADRVFHVSGIMAVLAAGIIVSHTTSKAFSPGVIAAIKSYWVYAAFVANSFIFLMLGFTEEWLFVDLGAHRSYVLFIALAVIAVTLARAVIVYGLIPLNNRLARAEPIDIRKQTIIFWGGLRGAIPMALAMSLPQELAHRELVVDLTLGVVLFTILVQGTTITALLKILGISRQGNGNS